MAPSPRSLAASLGVVALLLAGCGDDGGETTTATGLDLSSTTTETSSGDDASSGDDDPSAAEATTSTTEAPSDQPSSGDDEVPADIVATACAGLAATMLLPVDAEYPEDDAVLLEALDALAEARPASVGEAAARVRTMVAAEEDPEVAALPPEALEGLLVDAFRGMEEVHAWGLEHCDVEGVVWACPATSGAKKFEAVGEAIGGDDTTTTTEPGAATPEAVFSEGTSDGEPVVVSRSDDEVVAAWLDEDGAAVEVITVVEDGGWRSDGTVECMTEEDLTAGPTFETVPADPGE